MYNIYGITDQGMVRLENEDAFFINGTAYHEGSVYLENVEEVFIGVADGMGGSKGGKIASTLVVNELGHHLGTFNHENIKQDMTTIHQRLLNAPDQNIGSHGMGSTLVAFKTQGNENILVNIGDSRGYLYRNGYIRQLTKDHTLAEHLCELGMIGIEQKHNHSQSHILTQCLGGDCKVVIDPHVVYNKVLNHNDILLFCSDGLYHGVNEDQLETIIQSHTSLQTMGQKLIHIANTLDGSDNTTIILIQVVKSKC